MAPRLLTFASGTKDGGGSGFENLVISARNGILNAEMVGVISNHLEGGVRERANRLNIPFEHMTRWEAADYERIVRKFNPDAIALSGWVKLARGLDSRITFNIHPGPLPLTKGMYGHRVHETALEAYRRGEIGYSAVTMHFVTEEYDDDKAVFFKHRVPIQPDDTPETLAKRVNAVEHHWQPIITQMVLSGEISWDGENPHSLDGYLSA